MKVYEKYLDGTITIAEAHKNWQRDNNSKLGYEEWVEKICFKEFK